MQIHTIHHTTAQFANYPAIEACTYWQMKQKRLSTHRWTTFSCAHKHQLFSLKSLSKSKPLFQKQFQLHANVELSLDYS